MKKAVSLIMSLILFLACCINSQKIVMADAEDWDWETGKKLPVITTEKLEETIVGEEKQVVLNAISMYGGEITWSLVETPEDVKASIDGNVLTYQPLENEFNGYRWLYIKATEENGASVTKEFNFCAPPDENSIILPNATLMVNERNIIRSTEYEDAETGVRYQPATPAPKNRRYKVAVGIRTEDLMYNDINWAAIGGYSKTTSVQYPTFRVEWFFLNREFELSSSELILDAAGSQTDDNTRSAYTQRVRVVDNDYNPIPGVKLLFAQNGYNTSNKTDADGYLEVELMEYRNMEITSLNMSPFIVISGQNYYDATEMYSGRGDIELVVDYTAVEPMINVETGYGLHTDLATRVYIAYLTGTVNADIFNGYGETLKQTAILEIPGDESIKYFTDNDPAFYDLKYAAREDRKIKFKWDDNGAILGGESEPVALDEQMWGDAALEFDFKGGIVTEINYEGDTGYYYKVLWFDAKTGEFICESDSQWIDKSGYHSFFCPTSRDKAVKYNVAILPKDIEISNTNWEQLQERVGEYGNFFENIEIKNNKGELVETDTLTFKGRENAIYITQPASELFAQENFYEAGPEVLMEATGKIALDEEYKDLKVKGIHITIWKDGLWESTFKVIEGLQVGKDYYPLTDDTIVKDDVLDENVVFDPSGNAGEVIVKRAANITFSDEKCYDAPCEFAVYFHTDSTEGNVYVSVTADIGEDYPEQKIGSVTMTGGGIGLTAEKVVGTDYAVINTEANGLKLIYDNGKYVMESTDIRIEVPLYGISQYSNTSHMIKVVMPENGKTEETLVIHSPGAPTLIRSEIYHNDAYYYPMTYMTARNGDVWSAKAVFANGKRLGDVGEGLGMESSKCIFIVNDDEEVMPKYIPAATEYSEGEYTVFETKWTGAIVHSVSVMYISEELTDTASDINKNSLIGDLQYSASYVIEYENIKQEIEKAVSAAADIASDPEECIEITANAFDTKEMSSTKYSTGKGIEKENAKNILERLNSQGLEKGKYYASSFSRKLNKDEFISELGNGEGYIRGIVADAEKNIYYEDFVYYYSSGNGEVEGQIILFIDRTKAEPEFYEIVTAIVFGIDVSENIRMSLRSNLVRLNFELPSEGYQMTTLGEPVDVGAVAGNFVNDGLQNWSMTHDILDAFMGTSDDILGNAAGAVGIIKGWADNFSNQEKLKKYYDRIYQKLITTPCFNKLDERVKLSLKLQMDDVIKANERAANYNHVNAGLNTATTGIAMGTGVMLFGGIGFIADTVSNEINNTYMEDAYNNAKLYCDLVDMQIQKYARTSKDPECLKQMTNKIGIAYRHDPAGVVYEAVLSNVVEGATVKLYTDGGNLNYIPEYNENGLVNATVSGDWLNTPEISAIDPSCIEIVTGNDGFYQWYVPQGLWYVTASKDGYLSGDSSADIAATVKGDNRNWIPVLPVQLNVNIPLISYEAPIVSKGYHESDGVYLEFSKYLDETNLTADKFAVKINGKETTCTLEKINSEQAPDNRVYETGAPYYTSKIKLNCEIKESDSVSVKVSDDIVSYSGVKYGDGSQAGTEISLSRGAESNTDIDTDTDTDKKDAEDNNTASKKKGGAIVPVIIILSVLIIGAGAFVLVKKKKLKK